MRSVLFAGLAIGIAALLPAQAKTEEAGLQIRVTPASVNLKIGDSTELEAQVLDVGGRPVDARVFFFTRDRRSVQVDRAGKVTALRPGKFQVVARMAGRRDVSAVVPVNVAYPKPVRIEFAGAEAPVFAHTTAQVHAALLDQNDFERTDIRPAYSSSDPSIATVDASGTVLGQKAGQCEIRAAYEGLEAKVKLTVRANPVRKIELAAKETKVRTGDVVHFTPHTMGEAGQTVAGVPVTLSFFGVPDDRLGNGATAQIEQDGRFVAEKPGRYTILATCGNLVAQRTLEVVARNVQKKAVLVGHGEVFDVHTSDLWVWEGKDGRDYCVTGTWGANGEAHFWDVTDPANMKRISTVRVDARTVNDVKVSADGRLCILSREGASNRKNGVIVLDVSNPRSPKRMSSFDKNLTGGVHNVFIDKNYLYALSAGRRYDIIDIKDPEVPYRVASYELKTERHSIHDVWVTDGIAYSSNWRNGIHLVDVGNGMKGGSPTKPVKIGSYAYPSGWNHAAFPYRSKATGKFYVIGGDEAFPFGLSTKDRPTYARGWFHFIDFTDVDNPQEVARYEVPEAGTHNLWVEDDVMYGAYYNAGLRVVDISGELMGDLYKQGREIAFYLPTHHKAKIANAPMVWGPQPHKGHIFFSDWNSGLWAVKLVDAPRGAPLSLAKVGLAFALAGALTAQPKSAPAVDYYLYVAAESADEIYKIKFDGTQASVVGVVPVGYQATEIEGAHGLTVSPDGMHWFVTMAHGKPNGILYKYSTESDELLGETTLGLFPATMQISEATGLLYCVNFNLHGKMLPSSVSIVDPDAMKEVARTMTGPMPHGSRVSADGFHHYSCSMMDGELFEIDALTFDVVRRLQLADPSLLDPKAKEEPTVPKNARHRRHEMHGDHLNVQGMPKPTWVHPHPKTRHAYVCLNGIAQVAEVDLDKWRVTRRFKTGKGPYNIEVSPDGKKLLVSYKSNQAIGILAVATGEELARLPSSRKVPHGVVISPDGRYGFVSSEGVGSQKGTVDVVDMRTHKLVATVKIGLQAGGMAFWKAVPRSE